MGVLNTAMTVLAWVLIAVATISTATSFWYHGPDIQEPIRASFTDNTTATAGKAFVFLQAYQIVTPAIVHDWLGDPGKHIPILEEIPLPDGRDVILLFPFWWIAYFVARAMWNSPMPGWKAALYITLMFVVVTVAVWLLVKVIMFYLMRQLAQDLGINATTLTSIRQMEFEHISKVIGLRNSLLLTAAFAVFYLKALIGGSEEK